MLLRCMTMINESPATEKEYVVIIRGNNMAINLTCADVRFSEDWLKFENAVGGVVTAFPAEVVLMVMTGPQYIMMQKTAQDEVARQAASPIIPVDPVTTLEQSAPTIVQP